MRRYSIILPVRNGGEYIKDCIGSILAQTYPHFNLIILDSGSTDGTIAYVNSLNDRRIELHVSERPLSIEENWHRITQVPKNEFITLTGHDDLFDKNYLAVMDSLIEKHPGAGLYQTHFRYINSEGETIRKCRPVDEVQTAAEFLAFFLGNIIDTMGTGFMMRSADYDAIGGIPLYPNLLFADFELWINLAMKSYKATAYEECFAFRLHQSMTTTSSDIKFHDAFAQFINYLEKLKSRDHQLALVVERYGIDFIRFHCKGLAHRLLRTPIKKRNGKTVENFIKNCKEYADRIVPGNNFEPGKQFNIKLAETIDNNFLTRALFLGFKKLYSKPIYS